MTRSESLAKRGSVPAKRGSVPETDCRSQRRRSVPVRVDGIYIACVRFALRATAGAEEHRGCPQQGNGGT